MTPAVYTLASGGWLVIAADGRRTLIAPLPVMVDRDRPKGFARLMRSWADDIERAAVEQRTR